MVDNCRSNRACLGGQSSVSNNKTALRNLQVIDFAITETVLYLNAYPDSAQALAYYHKLVNERKKLVENLSRSGHPMTQTDNSDTGSWRWNDGPWPWQPEAN